MTAALATLSLVAASSALQRAHTTLSAAGYRLAAQRVHEAGRFVAEAIVSLAVEQERRRVS